MTDLYAGLDVSLELTNICVVDADGRLVHEARIGSDPEMISAELRRIGDGFVRAGFEAGPLSQRIFFGLKEAGRRQLEMQLPGDRRKEFVISIDTAHVRSADPN